ncbi:beta-1,3-galactosyltransferase 1-like isoform X1 [Rhynchophorus ferrugineus]|uniref:beta-1,3-galactosyltransferase 1-like isoform X1 n=1 Tax=Rhynchophorus ferrugineus TaxID=354439 RepID=UPI003FCD40B8
MRSYSKLFFMLCIVGTFIFCLFMVDISEVEIAGWEFNVSRNLHEYILEDQMTTNILPSDFCNNSVLLVIMCISHPSGFKERTTIRETWGKDRDVMGHNISLYFLIGETDNMTIQHELKQEADKYNDIIQERFVDSYNNLTIKSAMMLKLFMLRCENTAKFLLKIDQDIYLNLPKLVDNLITRNQTENLLMGAIICGAKPIKDYKNKWYAGPSHMYRESDYPKYLSGPSYCMSKDVPKKLLKVALLTPVFHLEDVYLTGICATKIHLNLTNNELFTYRHYGNINYCIYKSLITVHYQSPDSIRKIHHAIYGSSPSTQKKCEEQREVYLVHRWLTNNILTANKSRRRRTCSP